MIHFFYFPIKCHVIPDPFHPVENGEILYRKDVAVSNQYIVRITNGESLPLSDSTIIIDGTNKYLIPGLWDMHVHMNFDYEDHLQLYLANGVTGVRDMNGMHRSWKEKPEGSWLAPRFVIGSRIIDGPKPRFGWSLSVNSEEDAREADDDHAAQVHVQVPSEHAPQGDRVRRGRQRLRTARRRVTHRGAPGRRD